MTDKYYRTANRYLKSMDTERAITSFISGVDRGYDKCAFGLIYTVYLKGSNVMTEDEALEIFGSHYGKIKALAKSGDADAMVMVAESMRYGFCEDDDEPYEYWLHRASQLGSSYANRILEELEELDAPLELPRKDDEEESKPPKLSNFAVDRMIRVDPDVILLDQLGFIEHKKASFEEEREGEEILQEFNF